ncbi:Serine-threonine/tyrosine-protein kinase, catalytic domain, partial [Dillenia turbinata]
KQEKARWQTEDEKDIASPQIPSLPDSPGRSSKQSTRGPRQPRWEKDEGSSAVLDETGRQGAKEFLTEILVLSQLRHPNLVHMIGYCQHDSMHIVVYELLPFGSLDYNLCGNYDPLDRQTGMKIAVGAARGLHCLRNEPPIKYKDMMPANTIG